MFIHFSVQTKCWVQKLLREQGEAGEGQEDHTYGGHHGKGCQIFELNPLMS